MEQASDEPSEITTWARVVTGWSGVMSRKTQRRYLDLMLRGMGPAAICQELHISAFAVRKTLEACPGFEEEVAAARQLLSHNIEMALYVKAMKGNVSAMQFWLKHHPLPGWKFEGTNEGIQHADAATWTDRTRDVSDGNAPDADDTGLASGEPSPDGTFERATAEGVSPEPDFVGG